MNNYIVVNKTFVKSKNKSSLIINRYFYSLLVFILFTILLYLVFNKTNLILPLVKSLILSLIIAIFIQYIINLISKNNKFVDIFRKDYIHIIALIIGLFGVNINILVLFMAIFISLIVKKIINNINLSVSLYGILIILLYKYFTSDINYSLGIINDIELTKDIVIDYLIGTEYLSPVLSLFIFIYLFYKKSIKYNIFISYICTIFIVMLLYGIFNGMNLIFPFIYLSINSIIFLSVYTLTDYIATPTINETQRIYGVILGFTTSILSFIVPVFAVVIPHIVGPIILTKYLDNMSYKIKYRKKEL